ncbi:hypothetical protein SAMN06272735_5034 [Streptomyces sp. TLI_55]|uniref:hypothetical protein n=1 Tax=Streptomyces sp. TLI_55 TaxID=1938861 RepID=UPI000BC90AA4|nr:hypothetical protein [Streptomyces sp. TLI_55]SNX63232.1 hypothetical protein SAMN06272735_5034 [Streptomyces sp. TLI_55]
MARRTLPVTAAAFATMAALLLSACGGGDDSSSDDIKGADTGASSPSASASASASSDVKRPKITIPSSFQLTFADWTSSDAAKQAVLNDAREELRAGYAAIIADEPDGGEATAFYTTKPGLLQAQQWIKTYTDKDLSVVGKLPVYDPKVILAKEGVASLSYCTDESKAYSKERKTGTVAGNPSGTDPKVSYTITIVRNEQGVWLTDTVHSQRGGC